MRIVWWVLAAVIGAAASEGAHPMDWRARIDSRKLNAKTHNWDIKKMVDTHEDTIAMRSK